MNEHMLPSLQLCYTVKQRDLKLQFRGSAPELVRSYCEKIESQAQDQEVTIQFQWQPQGLEFTIAGLDDGVAAALELIQKEFKV